MGDFIIAIHGVPPSEKWRDRGVDTFIVAGEQYPNDMKPAKFCAAAHDLGCKAWIPPMASLSTQQKLPGFAGWAMRDEPEGKMLPGEYRMACERLRGRGFPIFGNFTHMLVDGAAPVVDYRIYTKELTHFGFDWHIINRGQDLWDEMGLSRWERIHDGLRMCAGRSKVFIPSVETGPHLPTSKEFTVEKFRRLCFKARDLGAGGIVLFSIRERKYGEFSFDVTPPEIAEAMPSIFAELRQPLPTVESLSADLAREREASAVAAEVLQAAVVREAAALEKIRNAREALG